MNDITAETRQDFIADHNARVTRTLGDLHATARRIRADIATLDQYPERAYREDMTALLDSIDFGDVTHKGYPALTLSGLLENLQAVAIIMDEVRKQMPRKWSAIHSAIRTDGEIVYWELPREPDGSDLPYEAAA
jgi:hypothetical protein